MNNPLSNSKGTFSERIMSMKVNTDIEKHNKNYLKNLTSIFS